MAQAFEVSLKITGREDVSRSAVKAERSLSRLGDRGSRALRRIGTVGAGVRRSLQAVGRAIFSLRGAVVGLLAVLSIRAVVSFFSSAVSAANEQREAEARLTQALGGATEALKKQAAELQKLTGIGDEVTISMMALLGTFQISQKGVAALTPGILDMAAAMKLDLNTASLLIGKAMTGQTGTLSRYGIVLTDTQRNILQTGTEMAKVAIINELLTKRFGGTAEAVEKAHQGAGRLKSDLGDLKELIGDQFIPTLKPLIALSIEYVAQLQNWIKTHNVAVPVLRGAISVLGFLVQAIGFVSRAWIGAQIVVIKVQEVYRRALAVILAVVEKAARFGQRFGLVSAETVRAIAQARTAQLEAVAATTQGFVDLIEQAIKWDRAIKTVQDSLGEFRAAIVPQMEGVGDAARRASDALAGFGQAKPPIDDATDAMKKQKEEADKLAPTLDDLGRITQAAADAQGVLATRIDVAAMAMLRARRAAKAAAAATTQFAVESSGRIAFGAGVSAVERRRIRREIERGLPIGFLEEHPFARHGAILDRPTHVIAGEAGRELVVPARREQRSPQVQAEFERLAAEESGGDIMIPVQINLDGRVLAKAVFRQRRRGVK